MKVPPVTKTHNGHYYVSSPRPSIHRSFKNVSTSFLVLPMIQSAQHFRLRDSRYSPPSGARDTPYIHISLFKQRNCEQPSCPLPTSMLSKHWKWIVRIWAISSLSLFYLVIWDSLKHHIHLIPLLWRKTKCIHLGLCRYFSSPIILISNRTIFINTSMLFSSC